MNYEKKLGFREDVSETIYARREKGVLKALEELERDISQWGESMENRLRIKKGDISKEDLAVINEFHAAVDQLLDSTEKLVTLVGGDNAIIIGDIEKLIEALRQVFENVNVPGPKL